MVSLAPVPNVPPVAPIAVSKARAAASLGISVRNLHSIIQRGELRAIRCGGRILVPVAELERFLAALPAVVASK